MERQASCSPDSGSERRQLNANASKLEPKSMRLLRLLRELFGYEIIVSMMHLAMMMDRILKVFGIASLCSTGRER